MRALAHRDFRFLLFESMLNGLLQPVQYLTAVFWVQDNYPDQGVVFVGLIAFVRGLGLLSFSFFGGAIADRFPRRRVLLFCEGAAALIALLTALTMITSPLGDATVVLVLFLAFALAANMAIDMPARAASLADIGGRPDVANAISLNTIAQQLLVPMVFPALGFFNTAFDPGYVYLASLGVYALILPLVLMLRYDSVSGGGGKATVFRNIRDGLAYTRRDPTIFAIVAAVMVMHVVGMPGVGTLGPVWMTKILGLSKAEFGFMAMGWGIGATIASLFYTWRYRLAGRGAGLCFNVLLFAVAGVIFGHSRYVPLTALAFLSCGFAMVGTLVTASTIIQHIVSDEMRGRVMALFPLAMGLAMLNAGPVSAAGQIFGLEVVVPILTWSTLLITLAIVAGRPALRHVRSGASLDGAAPLPLPALE